MRHHRPLCVADSPLAACQEGFLPSYNVRFSPLGSQQLLRDFACPSGHASLSNPTASACSAVCSPSSIGGPVGQAGGSLVCGRRLGCRFTTVSCTPCATVSRAQEDAIPHISLGDVPGRPCAGPHECYSRYFLLWQDCRASRPRCGEGRWDVRMAVTLRCAMPGAAAWVEKPWTAGAGQLGRSLAKVGGRPLAFCVFGYARKPEGRPGQPEVIAGGNRAVSSAASCHRPDQPSGRISRLQRVVHTWEGRVAKEVMNGPHHIVGQAGFRAVADGRIGDHGL